MKFSSQNMRASIHQRLLNSSKQSGRTPLENDPVCFEDAFAGSDAKAKQWTAFLKTSRVDQAPPNFAEVVAFVASFIAPVIRSLGTNQDYIAHWPAGGPWVPDPA